MTIFKTYFKIIKKQAPQLLIYFVVFLGLAILFSTTGSDNPVNEFTQSKTKVAFINEGEETTIIKGFKDFLGQHSEFVDIENKTDKLQDALFYKDAEYILKVPAGFTEDLMAGKDVHIEKTVVSGSTSSIYTDILVNKYFNTVKLYINNNKGITQEDLVTLIAKDLKLETEVQLMESEVNPQNNEATQYYYNYLAYILISVIILGVSSIMLIFNNLNLKRRNLCSPVKNTSMNLQILSGNIVFSLVCWAGMVALSFILYRDKMMNTNGLYFILNSFVFTFTVLSLSFLIGTLIKNKNAQSGISNVLSLGLSFLSGVFVPQNMLSESVLAMAKFTPTYWFVKANNAISTLTNFSAENLAPIITSMLIQVGFAIALVSITLVLSKRKQLRGA